MLRSSLSFGLLAAAIVAAGHAAAQTDDPSGVDFVLRPSQDVEFDPLGDPWRREVEPTPPPLETLIGPPMAGPTEETPVGPPLLGPAVPVEPEQPPRITREMREAAPDPFEPAGVHLGSFVIRPGIEIGAVATDNAAGTEDKVAANGLVLAPDISIRSEDDRHEFFAEANGEAVFYDREQFNGLTGEARMGARYELTSRTAIAAEAGYSRSEEGFTDPDTPGGAAERPVVHGIDALLGVEQRFGRFAISPAAFVEREVHEDVPLTGGGVASRKELDNTEYGLRVRSGYEATASLTPFIEVAAGRRDMDQPVDDSGFRRSSVWGELLGGVVIDRGTKLTGEFSLGYRHEDLEDDRLEPIDAFLANAAILWSPRRLTEIRFDLSTETQPTSIADVSATILYSGTLTVARRLTARTRVEAGAGLEYETPLGNGENWEDITFNGFAGASYAFSRTASVVARYEYEQTESTQPDNDSAVHTVTVRLRLQR